VSISIRPYVRGDDDALRVDILNRAYATDEDFVPSTLEETRRWDQRPNSQHDHRFIAELDGVPVGVALAQVDPERTEPKGFIGGPHIVPEHRRKGAGTALAEQVFQNLRERGMREVETEERDRPATDGFLKSLGFSVVRAFSFMRRNLDSLPSLPGLPPGVDIGLVEPTDDILQVNVALDNEAFCEHYNHRPATLPEYRFFVKSAAEDGAKFYLRLARVDGRPVGYLWYGYFPREIASIGKKRSGLWDIGVLKPYRGHGIASALMVAAMADLKQAGMVEAELRVDDTNVTGARRVYEKLGFTLAYRTLAYRRSLV
jgi:mycothiol synthase